MMRQEELFKKILILHTNINRVASFIQNDFDKMLKDGTTTKEQIYDEMFEMVQEYDLLIRNLENYKGQAVEIMTQYYSK